MKKVTLLGLALCGYIAHGQTSLDQGPREKALSAAEFNGQNSPADARGVEQPVAAAATPTVEEEIAMGKIKLAGGAMLTGTVIRLIPVTAEISTPNGTVQVELSKIDPDYVVALFPNLAGPGTVPPVPQATSSPASAGVLPTGYQGKPLKDGLNIVDFTARSTEEDSDYDHVGWKVVLYNNSDAEIDGVNVTFTFLDKNDIELDNDEKFHVTIPARTSLTVTGNTMLKTTVWSQVDSYRAETGGL